MGQPDVQIQLSMVAVGWNPKCMQALTALVGAVIGGVLVILGDAVRQRAERRRERVQRLVDGATTLAVQYTRLAGLLTDSRLRQGAAAREAAVRPERYEAIVRFF